MIGCRSADPSPAASNSANAPVPPDLMERVARIAPGSPSLKEDLDAIVRSGNREAQRQAAEQLVSAAKRIGAPAWIEQERPKVVSANAQRRVTPTPAQLEAQLVLWQEENLDSIVGAMKQIVSDVILDYALGDAADTSVSIRRRESALSLAERQVQPSDRPRSERCAALRAEISPLVEKEKENRVKVERASSVAAGLSPRFRECYKAALTRDPALEVDLRLTLEVDTSGSVKSAKVDSTSAVPRAIVDCLERAGQSAKFPPSEGSGTKIVIPVNFVTTKSTRD